MRRPTMNATMREQIATAQPCTECGVFGHDAADHDDEPTPEQAKLELNLREYVATFTGRRMRYTLGDE